MKVFNHRFSATAGMLVLAAGVSFTAQAGAAETGASAGKKIAFDRKKGNCLACHMIEGGKLAGNIAPPLIGMKSRFPDRAKLRAQIWDASRANPTTIMPPFGRHKILSDKEVDLVTEFVHSL
ncbi:MAG TPA: sulfur oxidation c-type cytochrome SoxX [Chromatiales bacterium]|nr:sulfur oxidation c-type cytochrome SoxX [Chromatiales bacterium]